MVKIKAPIKERILQFIDYKGFSKKYFFENLGVSASNFRSQNLYSEISGDVIAKILSQYPVINPDWLIMGTGGMLRVLDVDIPENNDLQVKILSMVDAYTAPEHAQELRDQIAIVFDKLAKCEAERAKYLDKLERIEKALG